MPACSLCKGIGLAVDTIKKLFTGEAVAYSGILHSPEHDRDFSVQDAKLQIFKGKDTNIYKLKLNGQNIAEWFKEQFNKISHTIRRPIIPQKQSGGIKM